jgi:phage terminase small subunit
MKHGGKRPGAGRPRKQPVLAPASPAAQAPNEFLLATMRDPSVAMNLRIVAAKALLPFTAKRTADDAGAAPDDAQAARNRWRILLGGKE